MKKSGTKFSNGKKPSTNSSPLAPTPNFKGKWKSSSLGDASVKNGGDIGGDMQEQPSTDIPGK